MNTTQDPFKQEPTWTDQLQIPGTMAQPNMRQKYLELKDRAHHALLQRVDLAQLQKLDSAEAHLRLRDLIDRFLADEAIVMNESDRRMMVRDIGFEMFGLGPLEMLMSDPTISDILINRHDQVFVERNGRLELTELTFTDDDHLMKIIDKIVATVGRRVDEASPMVDARLPDGSRVNAIIPPLAIDGPVLSIRRFGRGLLHMQDLLNHKTLTDPMSKTLEALVKAKINVLISGGTGSGKTTLLNLMSGSIPSNQRLVTIEDAAELQLQQTHVVRLETRPPNLEGKGEVSQRALVRNALRMRPDRIIVGETRGAEAFDMLQAMNTGHEGSMSTVHANSPRDALMRLEDMVGMAGMNMSPKAIRQQIASAIGVVVQLTRLTDGRRKIVSIQEITGMEGDTVSMQEIFTFRQTGIGPGGDVQGWFAPTGVRPFFDARLKAFGQNLPAEYFDPSNKIS